MKSAVGWRGQRAGKYDEFGSHAGLAEGFDAVESILRQLLDLGIEILESGKKPLRLLVGSKEFTGTHHGNGSAAGCELLERMLHMINVRQVFERRIHHHYIMLAGVLRKSAATR